MSSTPLDRDPGVAKLTKEGYQLTLLPAHVVIHCIPYVTETGDTAEGKFIIPVTISGDNVTMPDHQIDFMGEFPRSADGQKLDAILTETSIENQIEEGIRANFRFSNKPVDGVHADVYEKVKHYEAIICSEASVINPAATPRTGAPANRISETVFRYADTNAGRAGIMEQSSRLRNHRVGIIGLGGTGSYILDLLAKTPVSEIHLFDGDVFENHNAFRAPGAASLAELQQHTPKVDYFRSKYDAMRLGIQVHPVYISDENVGELDMLNFVFISIDSGPSRKLIAEHLCGKNIPFVDTGIDVTNRAGGNTLEGSTRVTTVTADNQSDAMGYLSFGDIKNELYTTNIQIAELNALNACQAVIEWKKLVEFYVDDNPSVQTGYDTQDNRTISQA